MKKLFLLFALLAGFSFCTFSQTIKVESGKAVAIIPAIPEVKTILSEEQLMDKKAQLSLEISMTEGDITRLQGRLSDLKAKLSECEAVCTALGYK